MGHLIRVGAFNSSLCIIKRLKRRKWSRKTPEQES